jgi:hypothetical protein
VLNGSLATPTEVGMTVFLLWVRNSLLLRFILLKAGNTGWGSGTAEFPYLVDVRIEGSENHFGTK